MTLKVPRMLIRRCRQPAKCGVCSFGHRTVITFTKVFQDSRLEECFSAA